MFHCGQGNHSEPQQFYGVYVFFLQPLPFSLIRSLSLLKDLFTNYFRQIREETATRLLEVAFNADDSPNKWWLSFSKKKFMNIAST